MKTIRILIADDSSQDSQDLSKSLKNYLNSKKLSPDQYEIIITDSIDSTLQTLYESKPFDIFFADINFSEKGNEPRNGYLLIQKAFEICPITFICVYSGTADQDVNLQKEYVDLLKRGMLADIYKKDFFIGSSPTQFNNLFKRAWNFCRSKQYIWDVWYNHQLISSEIENIKLHPNIDEDEILKSEIKYNLEAILFLLKNLDLNSSRVIVFQLILLLYHRCLEIYLTKGDDSEIITKSDSNKSKAESLFRKEKLMGKDDDGNERSLKLGDRSSTLRKIVAYSNDSQLKYGYLLNKYRNKSVHPGSHFEPELSNIIFANLTLTLYILTESNNVHLQLILSSFNDDLFEDKGREDLKNILGHFQNKI